MAVPEVNDEDKRRSMEQLKEIILGDIKLQAENRTRGLKILRRLTVALIGVVIIILMGFGIIGYLVTRPAPATLITLKHIQDLQKNVELEHKLVLMDRDDVTLARSQVVELQKLLFKEDSLKFKKDSLSKVKK